MGTQRRHGKVDGARMLRIAREHYLHERSKVEIAESEGLSRWQVARALDEAREIGIVTITVGDPAVVDENLGHEVTALLGISRTIVVGRTRRLGLEPSLDGIGGALAEHLAAQVREGQRVGLTWSRAIESMVAHLTTLAPCSVVQLAGALTFTGDRLGSVEVIRHVARTARGTAYPIYAPIFVESATTRASLEQQPEIAAALDQVDKLDLAVVSVGTWSESGSALYSQVPSELAHRVAAAGPVGEISGRVYDAQGDLVSTELDERILGISAAQLRRPSLRVIATSYGKHRAAATIAAARYGYADTLIIDSELARAILAQSSATNHR